MAKVDWQKNCKDAMWSMFWLDPVSRNTDAEKEALKENVARLIRLTTQKNAGQRGSKQCINWDALSPTIMNICCAATSLYLHGEFGDMPLTIEEPD